MAGAVQGFLQTASPLLDQTWGPMTEVPFTIGNTPALIGSVPPSGPLTSSISTWINTGAALSSDYGGTSNPLSGVEALLTCTVATINGIGPNAGASGPFTKPPAGTLILPYSINLQCVRFEVFGMYWDAVPAGTQCTRDSGVVWAQGGAAAGEVYDTTQAGNGGGNMGWGVIWNTATGKLQFVAKQVNGTGGVGLSTATDLVAPANGPNKPFYLDMRWFAPQLAAPAAIQILLDGTDLTPLLTADQTSWTSTTKLPSLNVSGSAKSSAFFPVICNNTPTAHTANPTLHFQSARIRIGSLAACTLENQK